MCSTAASVSGEGGGGAAAGTASAVARAAPTSQPNMLMPPSSASGPCPGPQSPSGRGRTHTLARRRQADADARPRRVAGAERAGVRERGAVGARARVPARRHSPGVRQRGERRPGAARERRPARGDVRHHQVPSTARGSGGRGRGQPEKARRRLRRPVHHPLALRQLDLGVAGDGASARARLRSLDRRLELQRGRAGAGAGRGDERTGREPGAVQPIRVPPGAARGVRAARGGARGLQPAGQRPPSAERRGRAGRRAPRAHTRPGAASLVPAEGRSGDPQVDAPGADRGQCPDLRLHALRRGHGRARRARPDRRHRPRPRAEVVVMRLGDTEVTRIGLGTNRLRNTRENREFLRQAVASGLNHIDTAHTYAGGESEETIGAALSSAPVVATKGGWGAGNGRPEVLRAQIEESLRRLRTDSIALYYLHRVDPETPLEESLATIKEYRDRGKVRHVGVSEVSIDQIDRAREVVPITAVQNHYNLVERKHEEVVDYCAREGIVFVPFFPLRGGGGRTLAEIAERHGATPAQITLAWLLKRSPVTLPIPGTLSIEHLRENLAALEIELSDAEFQALG